ncbi:uncharacterized protein ASCRUDRAFT_69034 [Ascoidea rubescens DSM 1968]|uniref:Uncharacterized protein n=1 Tax=Ascoidea rubescens DSM 1968 TaxID=1344418 RepID=A0A1D2VKS8_9ASCO|nr:hypothetical protein ASCRUDRAFT_69034 [Ascoidea rubescens DSM 1968]ODV62210.1 hypothetical protein ASCRUDRAFT_69034 [Ascoidea rubescens DSM 1968]
MIFEIKFFLIVQCLILKNLFANPISILPESKQVNGTIQNNELNFTKIESNVINYFISQEIQSNSTDLIQFINPSNDDSKNLIKTQLDTGPITTEDFLKNLATLSAFFATTFTSTHIAIDKCIKASVQLTLTAGLYSHSIYGCGLASLATACLFPGLLINSYYFMGKTRRYYNDYNNPNYDDNDDYISYYDDDYSFKRLNMNRLFLQFDHQLGTNFSNSIKPSKPKISNKEITTNSFSITDKLFGDFNHYSTKQNFHNEFEVELSVSRVKNNKLEFSTTITPLQTKNNGLSSFLKIVGNKNKKNKSIPQESNWSYRVKFTIDKINDENHTNRHISFRKTVSKIILGAYEILKTRNISKVGLSYMKKFKDSADFDVSIVYELKQVS